jgi:hypothetical protein
VPLRATQGQLPFSKATGPSFERAADGRITHGSEILQQHRIRAVPSQDIEPTINRCKHALSRPSQTVSHPTHSPTTLPTGRTAQRSDLRRGGMLAKTVETMLTSPNTRRESQHP